MPSVRLINHEAVPKCGGFEVRFSDGSPSRYFYWEDIPDRRFTPGWSTARRPWSSPRLLLKQSGNGGNHSLTIFGASF